MQSALIKCALKFQISVIDSCEDIFDKNLSKNQAFVKYLKKNVQEIKLKKKVVILQEVEQGKRKQRVFGMFKHL